VDLEEEEDTIILRHKTWEEGFLREMSQSLTVSTGMENPTPDEVPDGE
jgi:hypothetical protein